MSTRCMCSSIGHAYILISQEAQQHPLQQSDFVTGTLLSPQVHACHTVCERLNTSREEQQYGPERGHELARRLRCPRLRMHGATEFLHKDIFGMSVGPEFQAH